jgi:hypothetical protein
MGVRLINPSTVNFFNSSLQQRARESPLRGARYERLVPVAPRALLAFSVGSQEFSNQIHAQAARPETRSSAAFLPYYGFK